MSTDQPSMSRRNALKTVAGLGAGLAAGLAFGQRSVWAEDGARRRDLLSAKLLTKPIPSTGEKLPIVGLGTWAGLWNPGQEIAPLREVLRELSRIGGKVVDTAAMYGASEATIGTIVAELGTRDKLFIATKMHEGGGLGVAEMSFKRSKERLKTERIDLLQVHNLVEVQERLPLFREWKQAKQVRYIGVTAMGTGERLETLLRNEPMDFLQIPYAIVDRRVEERILPLAQEKGLAVLTMTPFGSGGFFKKFGDRPLPPWAAELGIKTWGQFALKYIISHPAITCAIPGTSKAHHLADNLTAAQGELLDEATRRKMAAFIDAG